MTPLWLWIVIGLAAALAALAVVVAMQPAAFRIARSATSAAPAAIVFDQVNDFRKWEGWSPWAKLDPEAKNAFEGPSSGVGSVFSWAGNNKIGEGRMTILESKPSELVRIKLEFLKPFQATSTAEFTFKSDADRTETTWAMYGRRSFMEKAFCLFVNMEKILGGEFEKGLASMKGIAETIAKG